jgi:hypothetical protein
LEAETMTESSIRDQIERLLKLHKKIRDGDYLTLREEEEVSLILGIPKFKDRKEMETRIDEFFAWVNEITKRK